ANPLERITNLSPLNRKLMFVADMLVSASSASTEIGTLWFYAMRRTLLHLDQFRFGELFFLTHRFGRNELALDSVRNKDGFALFARNAFSAERDVFDCEIDYAHIINTCLL